MSKHKQRRGSLKKTTNYSPGMALRNFVLKRDNYTCQLCGEYGNETDHIIPWPNGETSKKNLRAICHKCNNGRRVQRVDSALDADDWFKAIEDLSKLPPEKQGNIQSWPRRKCHRMEEVYAATNGG